MSDVCAQDYACGLTRPNSGSSSNVKRCRTKKDGRKLRPAFLEGVGNGDSIVPYARIFLRTRPARPNKPEPMSRREAGSGVKPPGFPIPVVPIKRHCSDSLQAPGVPSPPGQLLAVATSNPPVSSTWPISMDVFEIPLTLIVTEGAIEAQNAGFAIAKAFEGSQLFVLFNGEPMKEVPKSLVSKLNEVVWAKITPLPGIKIMLPKPAQISPAAVLSVLLGGAKLVQVGTVAESESSVIDEAPVLTISMAPVSKPNGALTGNPVKT